MRKKTNTVFVFFGKSGTGKTTLLTTLVEKYGIRRIHNTTTRPQRNKKDTEYNFVDTDTFIEDAKAGRYIAVRRYETLIEGTLKPHFYGVDKNELAKGGLIITDFQGFKELLKRNISVVGIYIYADDETRLMRSRNRPGFTREEFDRRCEDDNKQFDEQEIRELATRYPVYMIENGAETMLSDLLDTLTFVINNHL